MAHQGIPWFPNNPISIPEEKARIRCALEKCGYPDWAFEKAIISSSPHSKNNVDSTTSKQESQYHTLLAYRRKLRGTAPLGLIFEDFVHFLKK